MSAISRILEQKFHQENELIYQNKSQHVMQHLQHFLESQKMILEGAQGLTGEALILGFGGGNDIPIEKLAAQFDKITICEFDMETAEKRLAMLPADLKTKIVMQKCDLTGLLEPLATSLEAAYDQTTQRLESKVFLATARTFFTTCKPKAPELSKGKFSYIISSLVVSQLSSQIRTSLGHVFAHLCGLSETVITLDDQIDRSIKKLELETEHLKSISRWMTPQGKVFLSDTVSFQRPTIIGMDTRQMIPPGFFQAIQEQFKVDTTRQWVWKRIPLERREEFSVKAYLLSSKV